MKSFLIYQVLSFTFFSIYYQAPAGGGDVMVSSKKQIAGRSFGKFVVLILLAFSAGSAFAAGSQSQNGGGLDCNGYSNKSRNVKTNMICADPVQGNGYRFYDNGYYIGHDEPSIQFFSTTPNSGNRMVWQVTLPQTDPTPTQSGRSVATFELMPTFWLSLAVCDNKSYPQNPCVPDSDLNTGAGLPTDAGSAVMELQFYPPGYPPFSSHISCSATQWCAALNIDSLECTFLGVCNRNCTEPVNFAFIQTNGVPPGPPAPGYQTGATFTPNANTLMMNPGDKLLILLEDTTNGLATIVIDLTTRQIGLMVASAANGFANTSLSTCQSAPFNFHPEYSTAKTSNKVPWAALKVNVNFAGEIGHFELGLAGDSDADDPPCFSGPTIAGCLNFAKGGDLDFDGTSYVADWPDGSSSHPNPILIGALNGKGVGPMSFVSGSGYTNPYPTFQFETNVPFSEPGCNPLTGVGCAVPPPGAAFYPFYSQIGSGTGCLWYLGNDISGQTTNDFGKDAEYGGPTPLEPALFSSGPMTNPCTP
jgi:hypothetical protein